MRIISTLLVFLCLPLTSLYAQIDPLAFELGILDLNTTQVPLGAPTKSYASPDGLFFTTEEEGGKRGIIYYYDGREVKEIYRRFTNVGQVEFFFITSFNGGTMIVAAVTTADTGYYTHFYDEQNDSFNSLTNLGGGILDNYFLDGDKLLVQTGNARLASTDGSASGTVILGANNFLRTGHFYPYQGKFLFYAGDKVYLTDGTVAGTQVLGSFFSNGFENAFLVGDNYFYESDFALWKYDLTTNTSTKLTDVGEADELVPEDISHITPTTTGAQFIATNDVGGLEVWHSDGTIEGTQSLDLAPGSDSFVGSQTKAFELHNRLFFVGGDNSSVIYSSDGSTEGTRQEVVLDEAISSESWRLDLLGKTESGASYYTARTFNLTHFFTRTEVDDASSFTGGFNGDINGDLGAYFTENGVYVSGPDSLYYLDSEAATMTNIGQAQVEGYLGNIGESLLFTLNNNTRPGRKDLEPYSASPLSGSIISLGDIFPGGTSSSPQHIFERDGNYFFLAFNPNTFNGLYQTDGTPEGTFLAEDLLTQNAGSGFGPLIPAAGKLYFERDQIMWVSNGTLATSQSLDVLGEFWELIGEKADTAYFQSTSSRKILRTNGTLIGTEVFDLQQIIPNFLRSFPFEFIDDKFYSWTTERTDDGNFLTKLVAISASDFSITGTYFPITGASPSATGSITASGDILYAKRFADTGEDALFSLNLVTEETMLLDSDDERTVYYTTPFLSTPNRLIYTKGEGSESIISLYTLEEGVPLKIFEDVSLSSNNALFDYDGYSLLFTQQRIIRINADNSTETILEDPALGNFTQFTDGRILFSKTSETFPTLFRETWITDGTTSGTELFVGAAPGINSEEPYQFIRPFLLMRETSPEGSAIFLYNYEAEEFTWPQQPEPESFFSGVPVAFQDKFYFASNNAQVGRELHFLEFDYPQGATVNAYHDRNRNDMQDPDEPGINNISFIATTDNHEERVFTNENGYAAFVLDPETDYSITAVPAGCWQLISPPDDATVNFRSGEVISLNYGFSEATGNPDLNVLLSSAQPRCGFTVPFWLNILNTGCQELSGTASLQLPEGVIFVSGEGNPTVTDNVVSWPFSDIAPQGVTQLRVLLTLPGEEAVGEVIPITASATALNEVQDILATNSFNYAQVLSCAIDPNDKQVLPARQEPSNSNYTQFDETLIYTIRFQNTGTDTAFNVLLKDRLATRLDYSSFKPLTSSHDFHASIRGRNLEFFFENIMLPDSNVNEPLSHGFVTFEIKLDGERSIGALIRNEADIYFDYNSAIRT
ncbi:MAG: hypothetical protein AB8H12_17045, partial [Lewinella sp.]